MALARWCLLGCCVFPLFSQVNVLTFKNDNSRTGLNPNESLLSPATVSQKSFGTRFSFPVDGFIFAQPLYIASVPIPGAGLHNVVLVVTEHDTVYAFDADDNLGNNVNPLWKTNFLDAANGVTSVPWGDVTCPVIYPELGISGTPVVDLPNNAVYMVAFTKETSGDGGVRYVHRLHALDIRTGKELPNSPVEIQASVPGTGDGGSTVSFVPLTYKQRAALLLSKGVVYIAWSSQCDQWHYHGWVTAYETGTLRQVGVYNDTPNGSGASFWQAGAGPAADADGNVFITAANGTYAERFTGVSDLGDTILKLTPSTVAVADYFTPYNQLNLAGLDLDLGSSGPILLPPETGSLAHRNLLLQAGKEGTVYLVDRDNMGRYNPGFDTGAVQTIPGGVLQLFGSPAYYAGKIYLSAADDTLKAFSIANASLSTAPVSASSKSIISPGSSPIVSSNGATNGIVWSFELGNGRGVIHAFDAADVSKELFNEIPGSYPQFSVPMEADSKVYTGTADHLVVYGLLPGSPGTIGAVVNAASFNNSVAPGSLISIFGTSLARIGTGALHLPLPVSLADTQVSINGERAPLLYVSADQINAQVPADIPTGSATVVVSSSGAVSSAATFQVTDVAPEVFLASLTHVLALNQNGTVNSASNPAASGSIVTVFLTGGGAMDSPSATIGGLPASLTYAGPAPGTVGVAQMNMHVPSLSPGDYPLQVTVGGGSSHPGAISVK
ncbi:MAG: hypothetical protein U0Q18_01580 [Bryobacteraceae bacterium]